MSNLKSTANSKRVDLLCSHIAPEHFAVMSAAELLGEAARAVKEAAVKQAFDDAQLSFAGVSRNGQPHLP